jgi:transposase InsO family protein
LELRQNGRSLLASSAISTKMLSVKRFNSVYRSELVHCQGSWRNIQDLEMAIPEWVDWFNNRRLLGLIENIPPAEAEENFQAQSSVPEMVIGLD